MLYGRAIGLVELLFVSLNVVTMQALENIVAQIQRLERSAKSERDLVDRLVEHECQLLHEQLNLIVLFLLQNFERQARRVVRVHQIELLQNYLKLNENGDDVGQRLLYNSVLVLVERGHRQIAQSAQHIHDHERVDEHLLRLVVDILVESVSERSLPLQAPHQLSHSFHQSILGQQLLLMLLLLLPMTLVVF